MSYWVCLRFREDGFSEPSAFWINTRGFPQAARCGNCSKEIQQNFFPIRLLGTRPGSNTGTPSLGWNPCNEPLDFEHSTLNRQDRGLDFLECQTDYRPRKTTIPGDYHGGLIRILLSDSTPVLKARVARAAIHAYGSEQLLRNFKFHLRGRHLRMRRRRKRLQRLLNISPRYWHHEPEEQMKQVNWGQVHSGQEIILTNKMRTVSLPFYSHNF